MICFKIFSISIVYDYIYDCFFFLDVVVVDFIFVLNYVFLNVVNVVVVVKEVEIVIVIVKERKNESDYDFVWDYVCYFLYD